MFAARNAMKFVLASPTPTGQKLMGCTHPRNMAGALTLKSVKKNELTDKLSRFFNAGGNPQLTTLVLTV